MKTIALSLGFMVAGSAAMRLDGIPKTSIMQNQPNHWRKPWPEGVDNADGDAEVMWMFMHRPEKKAKPVITYPWNYDEDVISTGSSLETAEKLVGKKLTTPADGGLGMIFTYDNTAVQNTLLRDTAMGPMEYAKAVAAGEAHKLEQSGKPSTEKPEDKGFQYKQFEWEMKKEIP